MRDAPKEPSVRAWGCGCWGFGRHLGDPHPRTACIGAAVGAAPGPNRGELRTWRGVGAPGRGRDARGAWGSARCEAGRGGPGRSRARPSSRPSPPTPFFRPGLATLSASPAASPATLCWERRPRRHHEEVLHRWAAPGAGWEVGVPGQALRCGESPPPADAAAPRIGVADQTLGPPTTLFSSASTSPPRVSARALSETPGALGSPGARNSLTPKTVGP